MSEWAPVQSGSADWNGGGGGFGATTNGDSSQWKEGGADTADTAGWNAGGNDGSGAGAGDGDGGGGRGACFNCGEEGHNKADCPNPRVMICRHCNEKGHLIRDCPTAPPQEFTGECRYCKKEGHMAKDCPDKPPMVCNNCQEEGHMAAECKAARKIDRSQVADVNAESAWTKIVKGSQSKDMEDVKEGVQEYLKTEPAITYANLEEAFRAQAINIYLIALENPSLLPTHTHMDLQGNLDKKFRVHYRWVNKPARPREAEGWPQSTEENLERLRDAGETVERGIPKCTNCDEFGHTAKRCPQEKIEKERVMIKCYNCEQMGHRVRDCPEPRKTKFGCRNCGQGGHVAAECPEPRRASPDTECRKCNGTGHFAKDCPQGGGGGARACFNCGEEGHNKQDCPNPKKIQCRNCDEFGHVSKECPKPRDYSRVKCTNCGEMGHTKVRCKKEPAEMESDFPGGFTQDNAQDNGGNGGGYEAAPATASGAWEKDAATNDKAGDWEQMASSAAPATGFPTDSW